MVSSVLIAQLCHEAELICLKKPFGGHGMDSRTRLRRVSQRPGQAYSRTKQVRAVMAGACQAAWNLNQKILSAGSIAATSSAAPATHGTPTRQPIANTRAP